MVSLCSWNSGCGAFRDSTMRSPDELLHSHAQALLHALSSLFCPLLVCLKTIQTAKSRSKKKDTVTLLNATVLKSTCIYSKLFISTKKKHIQFSNFYKCALTFSQVPVGWAHQCVKLMSYTNKMNQTENKPLITTVFFLFQGKHKTLVRSLSAWNYIKTTVTAAPPVKKKTTSLKLMINSKINTSISLVQVVIFYGCNDPGWLLPTVFKEAKLR